MAQLDSDSLPLLFPSRSFRSDLGLQPKETRATNFEARGRNTENKIVPQAEIRGQNRRGFSWSFFDIQREKRSLQFFVAIPGDQPAGHQARARIRDQLVLFSASPERRRLWRGLRKSYSGKRRHREEERLPPKDWRDARLERGWTSRRQRRPELLRRRVSVQGTEDRRHASNANLQVQQLNAGADVKKISVSPLLWNKTL